jgi:hypothetical protein
LIVSFGTGQGVGSLFYVFITLLLSELSLWEHSSFLILAVLVIPYFHFFSWMEDNRLFHKQFRNVFKVDRATLAQDPNLIYLDHASADLSDVQSQTNHDHEAYRCESPLP